MHEAELSDIAFVFILTHSFWKQWVKTQNESLGLRLGFVHPPVCRSGRLSIKEKAYLQLLHCT